MRDIKELIYAAVEENAVKFQELVNAQLQVRAYDAIEALRPEVGASMFGEAKKMKDEEEEIEDEDEKKSEVDEELKGNQHKIDKNKNGKIDAHDFKLLRKEEVEELDELSQGLLRKASASAYRKSSAHSGIAAQEKQRVRGAADHVDHEKRAATRLTQANKFRAAADAKNEEVEELDELSNDKLTAYSKAANASRAALNKKWDQGKASQRDKEKVLNREKGMNHAWRTMRNRKEMEEEVELDEVAMPQNQADWQALITHQIKTAGHPVATDAQFRAPHGKDTSKIASQEPPEDKMNYAAAQGGTVKQ